MMLIDADYLQKALSVFCDYEHGNKHFLFGIETAREIIADAPTIDAVPVVRCKDCKYRDPEDKKCDHGGLVHQNVPFAVADDHFCADGERREDNGTD